MAEELIVDAQIRKETGKNANHRLRSEGMIPAILYGVTNENISLAVKPREITQILRSKKGANTLFHINMIGERTTRSSVMIKDYQIDPLRDVLIHCDFIRINLEEPIQTTVPIHIIGKAKGVTEAGGVMETIIRNVDIECLPINIPESIVIDVSELMIHDTIRIADLKVDEGITLLSDESILVLHIIPPRKIEAKTAEEEAEEAAALEASQEQSESEE